MSKKKSLSKFKLAIVYVFCLFKLHTDQLRECGIKSLGIFLIFNLLKKFLCLHLSFNLNIFGFPDPPGVPQISGYSSDVPIHAGKIQKMSCSSMGGNPVPTLTWYKNDVKVLYSFILSLIFIFINSKEINLWKNLWKLIHLTFFKTVSLTHTSCPGTRS